MRDNKPSWVRALTTVQQRRDNTCITQYWVLSQNLNTQKYRICVVSLSSSLESEKVFCIVSDYWSHQKFVWYTRYWAVLKKKQGQFFFFICKSKYETMDFLTNKKNTDTSIRLGPSKALVEHSNQNVWMDIHPTQLLWLNIRCDIWIVATSGHVHPKCASCTCVL
jgi:hypothetical protein